MPIRSIHDPLLELSGIIRKEACDAGQMTLGEFVAALSVLPADTEIRFDVGGSPCDPHSYRGYYDQLAFEPDSDRTARDVLADAKGAIGKVYGGYKGGDFRMDADTMIWCSTYGDTGRRVTGVKMQDGIAIVLTAEDV